MQGSSRRRVVTRSKVAAGSVWESRMRMDEVKGSVKVFNGDADAGAIDNSRDEETHKILRRNKSDPVKRKRKSWLPQEPAGGSKTKSPVQLRKSRSDLCNSPKMSAGDKIVCSAGEKGMLLIGDGRGGDEVELEDDEIEIDDGVETKSFDDKEIDLPVEKPKNVEEDERIEEIHEIPENIKIQQQQLLHPDPIKPLPVSELHSPPIQVEEETFESTFSPQNRMQDMVDLVMWRDTSKSAFVFGLGTFILLSTSYTNDINFSLISAISYLGLVYLAAVFLFSSILRRGAIELEDCEEAPQMVGEEEAIWLLRLLLPYVNELLIKLRALFSGDPETTMKMAVLLFVMARCGSSITIWSLAKLVFFGVFTVPRVCSSYKAQLTRYGVFWLERFRDGWESCTHKKAAAAAAFILMWNVSSTVARVWAVFMLVVGVRFYQQRRVLMEEWAVEGEEEPVVVVEEVVVRREDSKAVCGAGAGVGRYRQRAGSAAVRVGKDAKTRKWA